MAKCGFRKTKNGFGFYGDLSDCIAVAEKRVLQLQKNLPYITKRFVEEERRFKALKNSIQNASDFIVVAKSEIEKRAKEKIQEFEEEKEKVKVTKNE